jgi:hypothetical protein
MKNEKSLYLVYSLNVSTNSSSNILPGKPLFFSSEDKAESIVKNFKEHYPFLYDEENQGYKIYCLIIEEFAMDSPFRYQLSTKVYSPDGILLNDCMIPDDGPFWGRPTSKIDHYIGDLVEIPCGEKLIIGIIAEQPLCLCEKNASYGLQASDDCYTVIQHPDHEINYAHSPMVFKPSRSIEDDILNDLKEALSEFKKENQCKTLTLCNPEAVSTLMIFNE